MIRYKTLTIIITLLICFRAGSQEPAFLKFETDPWVEDQMNRLTLQEKIGQLIMIEAYPTQNEAHHAHIRALIETFRPGGLLMMKGSPLKAARWINSFQEASPLPLLVAIDGETGPGFRLDSVITFPNAQSLGAVRDMELVRKMGADVALQLKALGIHMNFAPVADINTNPENPIINFRSYGEDKARVVKIALAYAEGMQQNGIAAVAKHFPGHGDSQSDSHKVLPVIGHTAARIDTLETMPFRLLAGNGIAGIMTAHLSVPSIDPSGLPASLSPQMVNGMLKERLSFRGLVVTDAMNMRGVTMASGLAEVQALKAGNDMVVFVANLQKTVSAIEKAVAEGTLKIEEINAKCRKVLAMKRWLNLHQWQPSDLSALSADLNDPEIELTKRQLTEAAVTVLTNNNLLPLQRLDTLRIATLGLGTSTPAPFQEMVDLYAPADHFHLAQHATTAEAAAMVKKLEPYNLVICGIHGLRLFPFKEYGVTAAQKYLIRQLAPGNKLITLFFGNAYALKYFDNIEKSSGLLIAYQENQFTQQAAAQVVFGAADANGKLPVTADSRFKAGAGIHIAMNQRLKFTIPEEAGIRSSLLIPKIDSIAMSGINEKAYPGCQVLVAKDGKVVLYKCYGDLSYDHTGPVNRDILYDWASITKVAGPLPLLMKLTGEGRFDLNRRMSHYWPPFIGSNKENLLIRDVLTHQARLRPVIPLWQSTLARFPEIRSEIISDHPRLGDDVRISANYYMDRKYISVMYDEIRDSELLPRKTYTYTCMGFMLWPAIIERITGSPYDEYLYNSIYRPLGASSVAYNPYLRFPLSRIAPTETDDYFRMETLRGFVHDEGAALMGGISGNAGLFGTAGDLAKLFQMYLQKGYYGGERYLNEDIINEFTRVHFQGNRRGLGFDKPLQGNQNKKPGDAYPAPSASPESFGHTGFTGTFVWADPGEQLIFIFLSNRVHPTRSNNKLSKLNIRFDMQQAIYDAINQSRGKR